MTIKKRLFISNILMIVIPVIIAIITVLVCLVILNAIFPTLFEMIRESEQIRERQFEGYSATVNAQMVLIGFLLIAGIFATIYFTNRLLTKFVFAKVEQPLEVLSDGVHQIRDGNLDHRIIHYSDDEFKPICEDFNEMAVRLKASVEEIQKNERNRKELLASISHDLRSPLTSVKAYVEGLLDGVAATPETQREYLLTIKQKTDDINSMVSQLFLYSKMDMGNYPTSPERLNTGKEISDFISACREEYKTKGLIIETSGIPTDSYIYADPVQLRSIFANILDNSAKYKDKDIAGISVSCNTDGYIIRIVFEDDGPGVPDEALPKLFDVFYRSDPSRNNPQKGSGLGLAIAAKTVERMNGRIYAQNRKEGGLRMVIEIPEIKGELTE